MTGKADRAGATVKIKQANNRGGLEHDQASRDDIDLTDTDRFR